MAIINFQFGDFEHVTSNWFDWFSVFFSLLVIAISIYFAYYLGEKTYKRDRNDKAKETKDNIESEKKII